MYLLFYSYSTRFFFIHIYFWSFKYEVLYQSVELCESRSLDPPSGASRYSEDPISGAEICETIFLLTYILFYHSFFAEWTQSFRGSEIEYIDFGCTSASACNRGMQAFVCENSYLKLSECRIMCLFVVLLFV